MTAISVPDRPAVTGSNVVVVWAGNARLMADSPCVYMRSLSRPRLDCWDTVYCGQLLVAILLTRLRGEIAIFGRSVVEEGAAQAQMAAHPQHGQVVHQVGVNEVAECVLKVSPVPRAEALAHEVGCLAHHTFHVRQEAPAHAVEAGGHLAAVGRLLVEIGARGPKHIATTGAQMGMEIESGGEPIATCDLEHPVRRVDPALAEALQCSLHEGDFENALEVLALFVGHIHQALEFLHVPVLKVFVHQGQQGAPMRAGNLVGAALHQDQLVVSAGAAYAVDGQQGLVELLLLREAATRRQGTGNDPMVCHSA